MSNLHYPQFCALARAAEIIGERWTLLIIRELLLGPKRFGDLLDHLDGMSPSLLTTRLATLIKRNVVRRTTLPPPVSAQVYELTETGREIQQPAIRELIRWGGRFLFPPVPGDAFEPDWVLLGLDAIAKRSPVPEIRVGLVVHPWPEVGRFHRGRQRFGDRDPEGYYRLQGNAGSSLRRGAADHREERIAAGCDRHETRKRQRRHVTGPKTSSSVRPRRSPAPYPAYPRSMKGNAREEVCLAALRI